MNDFSFELPLPDAFDFNQCLRYMSAASLECLFRADQGGVNRLVRLGSGLRLIRVTSPSRNVMRVQLLQGGALADKEEKELAGFIREWFDLDRDLTPFIRLAQGDPQLAPLVQGYSGLRVVGIPDLFEALCWAIVGQQVHLTFAHKLKQRLTEKYGDRAAFGDAVYVAFPLPAQLEAAAIEDLCDLQLSKSKAMAIVDVASRMAAGELSRAGLLELSGPDAVDQELMTIRGVGPWTAQYVRMKCLGDPTALPLGDAGLQNAVKQWLSMDRKPTPRELRELFHKWRGWESYITFYLWRTLQ